MAYKREAPETSPKVSKGLSEYEHHDYSSTPRNSGNTLIKAQGKIIGYLEGKSFRKRVIGSKHKLRKPPAWCISKQAFCEEILPNTGNIVVEDVESGLIYECLTSVFAEHAFEIERGGYEPQLALGLKFWKVKENGHHQLTLWGGDSNA